MPVTVRAETIESWRIRQHRSWQLSNVRDARKPRHCDIAAEERLDASDDRRYRDRIATAP